MPLLTTGRSEEKEVDVVLGEVACSKNEGPPSLCKVRATNHCASSPSIADSLMLKPKCNFSNLNGRKKKRWMLRFVMQLVPKMKAHLLFVKFALLANVQLLQRRVRFLA